MSQFSRLSTQHPALSPNTRQLRLPARASHCPLPTAYCPQDSEQSAEIDLAVWVHPLQLGFGMARPSTGQIRSRDSETSCRASRPAPTPRRRPRKIAGNCGFGAYFEHLFTSVNGMAIRGARPSIPARRYWAAKMIAETVTSSDCSSVPAGESVNLHPFAFSLLPSSSGRLC
jgi:hypothetical protein